MNNLDLDNLLKAARVPERAPEYWERFPKRITAALHWRAHRPAARAEPARRRRFAVAAWAVGLATACVILGFAVGFWRGREAGITPAQLAVAWKYFDELEALFPNQIQAIVFDERGPRVVLAEKPNLPNASPIYVRVEGPRGVQRFITFSGQQIRLNGETCDVLLDAAGNVLLVGTKTAWTSGPATAQAGQYRFAARALEGSS